jgi:hypothetical protein
VSICKFVVQTSTVRTNKSEVCVFQKHHVLKRKQKIMIMNRTLLNAVNQTGVREGDLDETLKPIKVSAAPPTPSSTTPPVRSAFGAHGPLQAWRAKATRWQEAAEGAWIECYRSLFGLFI